MPAPLSAESYLPCKRRWNGSLTKAKYDWRPCEATVPPVRSSANPNTCSDALFVRSVTVTRGEKKFGTAPSESATMMTRPAPALCPSPNAIQFLLPLAATNVVSVSVSELRSRRSTASASLPPATACEMALSGITSETAMTPVF